MSRKELGSNIFYILLFYPTGLTNRLIYIMFLRQYIMSQIELVYANKDTILLYYTACHISS